MGEKDSLSHLDSLFVHVILALNSFVTLFSHNHENIYLRQVWCLCLYF